MRYFFFYHYIHNEVSIIYRAPFTLHYLHNHLNIAGFSLIKYSSQMQSPVLTVQRCATKSTRMYTSSPPDTHLLHCISLLRSRVVRTTLFLTLASGRNIWKSSKLLLSGSNTAVQKGSRQSYWKVCLKNQTPSESLPFLPRPIGNPPCPIQRHPSPGRFSIQGKRMHKAAACRCHRRGSGCLGKRQK